MNPFLLTSSIQAALMACFAVLSFESNAVVVAFSNKAIIARRKQSSSSHFTIEPSTSYSPSATVLKSSAEGAAVTKTADDSDGENVEKEEVVDYEVPDDAVISIKPKAMKRLRELKEKQKNPDSYMVLRMGVRNGGCSGLSYIMDFATEEDIEEDEEVDDYPAEMLKCVVDAKSMLYLYGLELDYSEELIGGGFKFFNPNAEESCGCGSSFGV
mmetsp:Transcript_6979/g.14852  ORF Transcript_6979/g.14852 Transcript_6979/m.14852 type:complete len:213 (-) Transcript_6979:20-658(-)|eukprot:CAMPEP_0168295486 /NCGR_PEP_ID=MMETSP0142_2-20121227/12184_1 /TAXON_ID=44445 /ORGANISM="Pseudo-nitzschia australis, Strain 10249 10 AB" /LENGTH=212 /DNA_ID=CAMNT_0008244177 /DNA_START=126 /DNA_END=764 /DNA_ORIENTATION=+